MPIDKAVLEKTINDLGLKISADSEAVGKLEQCRSCLNYLIPDDRIDERTQKTMTAIARQKIYDDNITLATTLLA